MRLNEGSIQISSQMLAKSLQEVPILVLGLIFIEITRGPFSYISLYHFHFQHVGNVTCFFMCGGNTDFPFPVSYCGI